MINVSNFIERQEFCLCEYIIDWIWRNDCDRRNFEDYEIGILSFSCFQFNTIQLSHTWTGASRSCRYSQDLLSSHDWMRIYSSYRFIDHDIDFLSKISLLASNMMNTFSRSIFNKNRIYIWWNQCYYEFVESYLEIFRLYRWIFIWICECRCIKSIFRIFEIFLVDCDIYHSQKKKDITENINNTSKENTEDKIGWY